MVKASVIVFGLLVIVLASTAGCIFSTKRGDDVARVGRREVRSVWRGDNILEVRQDFTKADCVPFW